MGKYGALKGASMSAFIIIIIMIKYGALKGASMSAFYIYIIIIKYVALKGASMSAFYDLTAGEGSFSEGRREEAGGAVRHEPIRRGGSDSG